PSAASSSVQSKCANRPPSPRPMHISAARAKQLTTQLVGAQIASNMLYRVDDPPAALNDGSICKRYTPPVYITASTNWGGYIAFINSSNRANAVGAHFNVASCALSCGPVNALATWVGIGGENSGQLIQTGVDQQSLRAWYELLPANPVYVFSVS